MKTLTITNLGGPLTRRNTGNIDSGLTKFATSWGYDPFSKPGNLTWMEQPTSILTFVGTAGPITIMKSNSSVVGAVKNHVYGIARSQNLYEIRVDNGSNSNFDSPSILGALPIDPHFVRSAGMVFYGSPEKIFISGDNVIQKINFDGSGAASISGANSILSFTSHPMTTFLGKIYFGNGNNIGEIDSTELITTVTKLSPALPAGTYVRDLEVTPDGNYLQMIVSRVASGGDISGGPDLTSQTAAESFKFLWNGIDTGATTSEKYGNLGLVSSETLGDKNMAFGYDNMVTAIFSGLKKILSLPGTSVPFPGATFSSGNIVGFASNEYDNSDSRFKGAIYNYGQADNEVSDGLFRLLRHTSSIAGVDIVTVPTCINVSNNIYVPTVFNYPNNRSGSPKLYYSTIESSVATSDAYEARLWKFNTSPFGLTSIVAGVYETQTQLFSKKVAVKEVRLYTEPLVADNAFTIDLIGSGGSVMSGGSQNFTVGTNVTAGEDVVRMNPPMAPTYALGVRITNASVTGTKNWTGTKLEIDFEDGGK